MYTDMSSKTDHGIMELLDIVNEYGEPTGQTVERETAHREGIMHRTAHVWLVREKDGRLQVLLQKRSANKDSFPGCYDISSAGHIPAGFAFAESAIRELREELGIVAVPDELVFCGDRLIAKDDFFHGRPFHDRQYSRVFFIFRDVPEEGFILQKEELESVLWMDFDTCFAAVTSDSIRHCIFPQELEMVRDAWLKARIEACGKQS